jgi:uncharacterized protein
VALAVTMAGLFFAAGLRAESVDKLPQPTGYVSDFAGVMDAASKEQIEELCGQVWEKAHAKVLVVTINSLDGVPIEEFGIQLGDKWKISDKGDDRRLIMLFAMQEHKDRIEVGYGLEGILNDAKVGDIRRSMHPLLEQGQYGPAMLMGTQQIANVIAHDAGVTLDAPQAPVYRQTYAPRRHGFNWVGIVIFLVILLLISRGGGGRGGGGWLWFLLGNMMGGGFGGGRGGFGGGDGEGGGGGGGFTGGDSGGGFGGGGASGDF